MAKAWYVEQLFEGAWVRVSIPHETKREASATLRNLRHGGWPHADYRIVRPTRNR